MPPPLPPAGTGKMAAPPANTAAPPTETAKKSKPASSSWGDIVISTIFFAILKMGFGIEGLLVTIGCFFVGNLVWYGLSAARKSKS